ncbi:hypothetical protein TKK_0004944 [Trichogramma kaykai]
MANTAERITKCRYVQRSDLKALASFIDCRTIDLFPEAVDPTALYEESCLALLRENSSGRIVSALFLGNHPHVPAVAASAWPIWIDRLYGVDGSKEENTLFVRFLVWDDEHEEEEEEEEAADSLRELFKAAFYAAFHCSRMILVKPPGLSLPECLAKLLLTVPPKNESLESSESAQVLCVADQNRFVAPMRVRLAIEEDNDDVVGILDNENATLRRFYGDYYLSEEVRHPEACRRVLVAERSNNVLVAVLAVNCRVDLDLLARHFELSAFAGFRKFREQDSRSDDGGEEEAKGEWPGDSPFGSAENKWRDENFTDRDENESERSEHDARSNSFGQQQQQQQQQQRPTVPNAFAVELFGVADKLDELKCQGLLAASFECFPERDYCLLLQPNGRAHCPFLDNFVRVARRQGRDFPMSLYASHRACLGQQGSLRAREARERDLTYAADLLEGVDSAEVVLEDVRVALEEDSAQRAFVFACDEQIVGLAVLRREEQVNRLERAYRLGHLAARAKRAGEDSCGRLVQLALMPIFVSRLGFLLGELLRLAEHRLLFYRLPLDSDQDPRASAGGRPIPTCLSAMQPLEPRIRNWPQLQRLYRQSYDDDDDDEAPFDRLFSLHVFTPRSALAHKDIVNVKIVVVGASDCALTFLHHLLTGPKNAERLRFCDVTLVSSNGLPYEQRDHRVRTMIPFAGLHCNAYRRLTSETLHYNVVKGTMTRIDRKEKSIRVGASAMLKYDYLVLACGLSFQRPEPTSERRNDNESESWPVNCFVINDDVDARSFLDRIKMITSDFSLQKSIVFYGRTHECYCALGAALAAGLRGSWITLVVPRLDRASRDDDDDDVFAADRQVKKALMDSLVDQQVRVLSEHELVDWSFEPSETPGRISIESLTLEAEEGRLRVQIDCDALVSFLAKRPSPATLAALRRSGLALSKNAARILVDWDFRTSDRCVFAAGTMAEFRRANKAKRATARWNSSEVGQKLAETFTRIVTSDVAQQQLGSSSEISRSKMRFVKPMVVSCLLPGGYRFLRVSKPGPIEEAAAQNDDDDDDEEDVEARRSDSEAGQGEAEPRSSSSSSNNSDVLTTGSCTADTGYLRLALNRRSRAIECLTCCRKTDFDIQNMIGLYGMHEATLCDLRSRFLRGEIPDLYAYLRQDCLGAIFVDDFAEDFLDNRHSCSGSSGHDAVVASCKRNARADLKETLSRYDYKQLTEEERAELVAECYERSCHLRQLEDRLSDFLERHQDRLSMYLTEERKRRIARRIQDNPLLYPNNNDDNNNNDDGDERSSAGGSGGGSVTNEESALASNSCSCSRDNGSSATSCREINRDDDDDDETSCST